MKYMDGSLVGGTLLPSRSLQYNLFSNFSYRTKLRIASAGTGTAHRVSTGNSPVPFAPQMFSPKRLTNLALFASRISELFSK